MAAADERAGGGAGPMMIVDNLLQAREHEGCPIRVGMIGAGFRAQGLASTIVNGILGMMVVGVYGRRIERAIHVCSYAGLEDALVATTQDDPEDAIRAGRPVVTDDAFLLRRSDQFDALVDVTGSVESGAHVILEAFRHGKHVILMNRELDATIGPVLQLYAERHGVILSACDGDEPGVQMNLYRWVRGLGLVPRVIGNVKGLQEAYRNPGTQMGFAEMWGQNPAMVASFADGFEAPA
jgi:predicted homoserine dehydrogenase-like protein